MAAVPAPSGNGEAAPKAAASTPAPASAPAGPSEGVREIDHPPPPYPAVSRHLRQQGEVRVLVTVDASGLPIDVALAASSGYPALDEAALTAVKTWRFAPALADGKPITAKAEIPVAFRLR